MFEHRAFDLTDDVDLVIYEFDRPTGLDFGLVAFSVHCSGPLQDQQLATSAA